MTWKRGTASLSFATLVGLLVASCQPGVSTSVVPRNTPATKAPAASASAAKAYARLLSAIDTFHVSGAVKTEEGLLLPEIIGIEVKSEICVESRKPGSRFWSLEYDTCFTFVSLDTVDAEGLYSVAVPCLDADRSYESRHAFGDLRLVQKGPVGFLADSDAGWRHQETFSSSRDQKRDLILTLNPEVFYVVKGEGAFQQRPQAGSPVIKTYRFGTSIGVIRFQKGWAQCLMDGRIGWMEMRVLGSEDEMKKKASLYGEPERSSANDS